MDLALEKKAHVFRFSAFLLEKLKELAKNDRRSLNNYVEGLLIDAVYTELNETSRKSLEDAKAGRTFGPVDTSSVEAMLRSMDL